MKKAFSKLLVATLITGSLLASQSASAGLLDTLPCNLVQTISSLVPLPVIGELLCNKGG
ncbi:hypothetical protein ACW9H6_28435 [Pseudomonas sp. SDO528_S397]